MKLPSIFWNVWLYTIAVLEECQIVGKCLSVGEEKLCLNDVFIRMRFILYRKAFSHNYSSALIAIHMYFNVKN